MLGKPSGELNASISSMERLTGSEGPTARSNCFCRLRFRVQGPNTQEVCNWHLGNNNEKCSTGFRPVYDPWVFDPSGEIGRETVRASPATITGSKPSL